MSFQFYQKNSKNLAMIINYLVRDNIAFLEPKRYSVFNKHHQLDHLEREIKLFSKLQKRKLARALRNLIFFNFYTSNRLTIIRWLSRIINNYGTKIGIFELELFEEAWTKKTNECSQSSVRITNDIDDDTSSKCFILSHSLLIFQK